MATKYVHGGNPAGAEDGSSPDNCWGSIQDFFDSTPAGGDTCLCYGSETVAATGTVKSSGTSRGNMNKVIGCDSSWTPGAAIYTINAGGNDYGIYSATYRSHWQFSYLRIYNPLYDCIRMYAWQCTVDHCILEPTVNGIMDDTSSNRFERSLILQCIIKNGSGIGISCAGQALRIVGCHIYGFTGNGVALTLNHLIIGCIIRDNTGDNIVINGNGVYALFCVTHGSGSDGVYINTQRSGIISSSITNNTGYGINASLANSYSNYSGFRSNTAGKYNGIAVDENEDDFDFTADPYIDESNNDFNMKTAADRRRYAIELDWNETTPKNIIYIPAGLISDDR